MKETKTFKLTPAQQDFVQKKLDEANAYLRTVDLSPLFERDSKREKPKSE